MRILHLIPARKGSKGLPGKNIKMLGAKPLFMYSVEYALRNMGKEDELCVSTNDDELINIANYHNISIPFKRPENLASDSSSTQEVIDHALSYYKSLGKSFDLILLLQPTSPFRKDEDYQEILNHFDNSIDMVASVKISKENPYFTLFEEDKKGFLKKCKDGNFTRRQDCPLVYAFNGSMYLINVNSLKNKSIGEFQKVKKIIMPDERSIDIDTILDWIVAEYYLTIE